MALRAASAGSPPGAITASAMIPRSFAAAAKAASVDFSSRQLSGVPETRSRLLTSVQFQRAGTQSEAGIAPRRGAATASAHNIRIPLIYLIYIARIAAHNQAKPVIWMKVTPSPSTVQFNSAAVAGKL